MKAFRYNVENRSQRDFNNTGREKNPNAIKFYATNMVYAEKYNIEGSTLEVVEVSTDGLFNMSEDFKTLNTYKKYISEKIGTQLRDYTRFMNEAKKVRERKMWERQIADLKNRESEIASMLVVTEFQSLSDFDLQNYLVAELKKEGFKGYITKNEIAIF